MLEFSVKTHFIFCWLYQSRDCIKGKCRTVRALYNWELKSIEFSATPHLIGGALRGLAELHVLLEQHESPELLQHGLDCVLSAPPGEDRNMSYVNLAQWYSQTGLSSNQWGASPLRCWTRSSCWFCSRIWQQEAAPDSCSHILEKTHILVFPKNFQRQQSYQRVASTFCSRRRYEEDQLSFLSRISNLYRPHSPGPNYKSSIFQFFSVIWYGDTWNTWYCNQKLVRMGEVSSSLWSWGGNFKIGIYEDFMFNIWDYN